MSKTFDNTPIPGKTNHVDGSLFSVPCMNDPSLKDAACKIYDQRPSLIEIPTVSLEPSNATGKSTGAMLAQVRDAAANKPNLAYATLPSAAYLQEVAAQPFDEGRFDQASKIYAQQNKPVLEADATDKLLNSEELTSCVERIYGTMKSKVPAAFLFSPEPKTENNPVNVDSELNRIYDATASQIGLLVSSHMGLSMRKETESPQLDLDETRRVCCDKRTTCMLNPDNPVVSSPKQGTGNKVSTHSLLVTRDRNWPLSAWNIETDTSSRVPLFSSKINVVDSNKINVVDSNKINVVDSNKIAESVEEEKVHSSILDSYTKKQDASVPLLEQKMQQCKEKLFECLQKCSDYAISSCSAPWSVKLFLTFAKVGHVFAKKQAFENSFDHYAFYLVSNAIMIDLSTDSFDKITEQRVNLFHAYVTSSTFK